MTKYYTNLKKLQHLCLQFEHKTVKSVFVKSKVKSLKRAWSDLWDEKSLIVQQYYIYGKNRTQGSYGTVLDKVRFHDHFVSSYS